MKRDRPPDSGLIGRSPPPPPSLRLSANGGAPMGNMTNNNAYGIETTPHQQQQSTYSAYAPPPAAAVAAPAAPRNSALPMQQQGAVATAQNPSAQQPVSYQQLQMLQDSLMNAVAAQLNTSNGAQSAAARTNALAHDQQQRGGVGSLGGYGTSTSGVAAPVGAPAQIGTTNTQQQQLVGGARLMNPAAAAGLMGSVQQQQQQQQYDPVQAQQQQAPQAYRPANQGMYGAASTQHPPLPPQQQQPQQQMMPTHQQQMQPPPMQPPPTTMQQQVQPSLRGQAMPPQAMPMQQPPPPQQQQQQQQQMLSPMGNGAAAPHLTPLAQGGMQQQLHMTSHLAIPPDASSTIFADGLPIDVTRREIGHIFRPFEGFQTVRLIQRDSVRFPGEKMYIGFIEFDNEMHAFTAMNIVNGYKLDDTTDDGYVMKLEFARTPKFKRDDDAPRQRGKRGGRGRNRDNRDNRSERFRDTGGGGRERGGR